MLFGEVRLAIKDSSGMWQVVSFINEFPFPRGNIETISNRACHMYDRDTRPGWWGLIRDI